ncbi:DUF1127 domain-containing protein [Vibrio sp. SCSIO 43136]|uniref:DUF1127 domain-containing protein n=1 Tax=Vibrio sp. SCSIO 43136 TaxID=2819101 RepID=UPI002074E835|nr:DUF1127 domain-containing protein [Vibrio sp. SCSIO 43136]USD64742.1 DUF1127 domain-containing protein [Vibrio sp. SCSIO 43136]
MNVITVDKPQNATHTKLGLVKDCLLIIKTWRQNYRTRLALRNMPDYLLDDIGITEEQRNIEVKRSFWH